MSDTFGGDFKFGGLTDLALPVKLKSLPILLFYLKSYLDLTMKELMRQTKFLPICSLPKSPNLMSTKCTTRTVCS